MIPGQKLSHAYIVSAPPREGLEKAEELASAMLCESAGSRPCGVCRSCRKVKKGVHPDVIYVRRRQDDKGVEKREIYVDQIREIIDSSATLPNESDKKVYIIIDAGTMNANAQNAFLKLLEEPPDFDAFILVADSAAELLDTVRSRCVELTVNGDVETPSAKMRELSEKYFGCVSAGSAVALLSFFNVNADMPAQDASEFIRSNIFVLSDMLCARIPSRGIPQAELMRLVRLMYRALEHLSCNVSVKHVFGMLSADTIDLK